MSKPVIIEKQDGILSLTLNRPEKKNALSSEMYQMLGDGLAEAAADSRVRVVLFNANGDAFCGGNDLKDFAAANKRSADVGDFPSVRFMKLLLGFEKPAVAAVFGQAVGIGTTLLFHCDVVVAGRSTTFSLPFTRLGLVPEFGSTALLPLLAGKVRASQILLLGESFGAEEARSMGIASMICDDTEVNAEAREKCARLASLPPETLRQTKKLIRDAPTFTGLENWIDLELKVFGEALKSAEHREALAAFFEKRQPDFSRFD